MNIALIVAAGKGRRMRQGKNKVLLKLDKYPVIFHTLKAFEEHRNVGKIIIVTTQRDIAAMEKIIDKYKFGKVTAIVVGGQERQDSVYQGLNYLRKAGTDKSDLVLIHNGGNLLVSDKDIADSVRTAQKHGAAVCAQPARDTIKRVSASGVVQETLDRSELWTMQTPQTIKFGLALEAFDKAHKDRFYGTDDVSLVERLGKRVKVVSCSAENIKITYPADLDFARAVLGKRRVTGMKIGLGQDSHRFTKGKSLVLGGIKIKHHSGLKANSDGDVVLHALCNALSGAVGKGSLATYSDEMCLKKGIKDSREYVKVAQGFVRGAGYKVGNVSIAIEGKEPKLEKHFSKMKKVVAGLLGVRVGDVGITVTSGEGLTAFGQGKGVQVFAVVSLHR
ncbi:MAG: 2-C-methyl-D-erythritol 4-phosphate cytidylyltransferase [Parcubacteria group bacterium]|nr:2-C-methyl-D-erythritol 4-phosphate cytidylyltransferase [Parcubacteria group bacterium]